jgi:c(7)-type cytochrome triheme protein
MNNPSERRVKMKILTLALTALAILAIVGAAMAVAPGKTSEWDTSMGKVTFDGKTHADAGLKCTDCHPKVFQMKAGGFDATMPDHNANEKYCWTCHDGTKAFETKGNCAKCHVK